MNTVKVTISKEDHFTNGMYNLPKKGEFIRLSSDGRRIKRACLKVIYSGYDSIKAKRVYKPSPKITLKNKSVFSKVKIELV